MTNLLVEGGAQLFGSLLDSGHVDEVHAFIAPKLLGGRDAPGPIAGLGVETMSGAVSLNHLAVQRLQQDIYVQGRIRRD